MTTIVSVNRGITVTVSRKTMTRPYPKIKQHWSQ